MRIFLLLVTVMICRNALAVSIQYERQNTIYWNYTVVNDRPNETLDFVYFPIHGPVQDVASPTGWGFDSNYKDFILWYSTDPKYDVKTSAVFSFASYCLEDRLETARIGLYDTLTRMNEIDVSFEGLPVPVALYGDVNNDRKLTVTDAILALNFIVGKNKPTIYQHYITDIAPDPYFLSLGDDLITIADVTAILNKSIHP